MSGCRSGSWRPASVPPRASRSRSSGRRCSWAGGSASRIGRPDGAPLADLSLRRRLTFRAEVHFVEAVACLDDGRSAAWAGFAFVAPHLHVVADLRPELRRQMLFHLSYATRDDVLQRAVE